MNQYLAAFIRTSRQVVVAAVALAGLGVLLWSLLVNLRNPCHAAEIPLLNACQSPVEFLVPLFVAFGFWAVGILVWLAARRAAASAFFVVVADILAVGMLAGTGAAGDEPSRVFQLLLACAIPLTWHFHHSLLDRPPRRVGRLVSATSCAVAIALSLPFFLQASALQDSDAFTLLRAAIRLAVMAAWALGWLLLFTDYRRTSSRVRGRIRRITFGTLFAFAPLVFLSFLPETSGMQSYVPYELTIPWLLLAPATYAYSLFRRRLPLSQVALNRAGVYYLLVVVFVSVYLAAEILLNRLTIHWTSQWPLISAFLGVALLLLFAPFKRTLERFMSWVLYGGEISYVSVTMRLADSLSTTLDRKALQQLLIDGLKAVMRLERIALLLVEEGQALTLAGAINLDPGPLAKRLPADGSLVGFLRKAAKPVADRELRRALRGVDLSVGERGWLSLLGFAYWLPLVSGEALQGVLLIGNRAEDNVFTAEDQRILATLSRQAGIAIHNVRLTEEVRAGQDELTRAHQQTLARVERERQQLALDLHDGAVQQLLGISYQVAEQERAAARGPARLEALETIRCGIVGVAAQLRELIGELRPPELEGMGIAGAIEGHVSRLEREAGEGFPDIQLDLDAPDLRLPDSTSICLFRAAQEALRNALKHAQAQHIHVSLRMRDEVVELVVEDDGRGFRVPARLSELASRDHYGLTGIAERVAWVGGEFSVTSCPGAGTQVRVRIPLSACRREDGSSPPPDRAQAMA